MDAPTESAPARRSRPRSATIAALLQILQSLGLLAYGLYLLYQGGWTHVIKSGGLRFIPFPMFERLSSALVVVILAGFTLLVSFAMLARFRWAWLVSMTLQGLGLFTGLVAYGLGRANYVGLLVGVVLVLYLNQGEVREAYQARREVAL